MLELLVQQLVDPFRIGLLAALLLTASNTAPALGQAMPLLAGLVFVAVLIPISFGGGEGDKATAIGLGLIANAVILGVLLAIKALWTRFAAAARK